MEKLYLIGLGLLILFVNCHGQLSSNDPCNGRPVGLYPQRGDCSVFIECTGTSSFFLRRCANGTLFDDSFRRCVESSSVTRTDCFNQNWNRAPQTWNQRNNNQNWNRRTNSPNWSQRTNNRNWNRPNRNQFQQIPRFTRPTYRQTWQTAAPSWQQWTNQRSPTRRTWSRQTTRWPWSRRTTRRPWTRGTVRPVLNQGGRVFINVVSNGRNFINRIDCQQLQRDVNFWLTNQARTYCRNCQLNIPTINIRCSQGPVRG